jgi:hypothetical protein
MCSVVESGWYRGGEGLRPCLGRGFFVCVNLHWQRICEYAPTIINTSYAVARGLATSLPSAERSSLGVRFLRSTSAKTAHIYYESTMLPQATKLPTA